MPAKIIPLAISAILLIACVENDHQQPHKTSLAHVVDTSDSIVLNTNWHYLTNYSGLFSDPTTGQDYIFSADPVTNMVVRIFNQNGARIVDVPLDSVYSVIDNINSIALLSKDSIFVLDERGERYLILDTSGRVVRVQELVDECCDSNDDLYELYPAAGLTVVGRNVYLGPALKGACNEKAYYERSTSTIVNEQRYYKLATGKCKIARIDPRVRKGKVSFGACGILNHLTDVPRETMGMAYPSNANGRLFLFSQFSSFIYEVDTTSLNVTTTVPIRYQNGLVGITPPPITKDDFEGEGHYKRAATKAYILSFTYDKPTNQYITSVCHEVPANTPEDQHAWRRNWSLIVLDSTFNKVKEHVLSGREYSGSVLLGMNNGTWVLEKDLDPQSFKRPKILRRVRLL